jgi:hypothetical protein
MDSSKESKTSSSTIDSQGLCGNLQGVHASKAPRCRSIPRCLPPSFLLCLFELPGGVDVPTAVTILLFRSRGP